MTLLRIDFNLDYHDRIIDFWCLDNFNFLYNVFLLRMMF